MKSKAKSAAKAPAKAARAAKPAVKVEMPEPEKNPAAAKSKKSAATVKAVKAPGAKMSKTKSEARRTAKPAGEPGSGKKKTVAKSRETRGGARKRAAKPQAEAQYRVGEPVLDPVGDTTDGEGRTYLGVDAPAPAPATQAKAEMEAFRTDTQIEASDAALEDGPGLEAAQEAMEALARSEAEETAAAEPDADQLDVAEQNATAQEPPNLARLQKILSQAGIASRRRAEEMIAAGRVMVNGQVVTTLGSKADPTRDHIRVDGKLLHGAERHRYFLLNKPRGYVTTVSDPEGRPTVMDFVAKTHERLYPVGRLDYQSEGLLLMTNDGELANLLTKAGSGVEKTYLVKVAGQPTEQELARLRSGVEIERGKAGSGRVETAPARVRRVRMGDNPWFEVVLTEGRNRELRKMFAAVGHFVEKIRRVGYGPLALDVEPGKMRELRPEEVTALRLTAEGKMKPRQIHADRMLPKDAGKAAEKRDEKHRGRRDRGRPGRGGFEKREGKALRPRSEREQKKEWRPRSGEFRGTRDDGQRAGKERGGFRDRRERRPFDAARPRTDRPGFGGGPRRERRESNFDGGRKPFRAQGERPYFKRGPGSQERRENAPGRSFGRGPGSNRGQGPDWSAKNEPRGEFRGPRQPAPEFRGRGGKFGGRKPAFGGKPPGFGKSRGDGGRGGSRPGRGSFGGTRRGR